MSSEKTTLRRSLGLGMLTFYGLGTIVGGGFYALVGKVAAEAGMLTPLAFLAAATIALFSAFSYAELSARYPYSAGEAHYVSVAFPRAWPAATVGWAVIATGVVSAATLAVAFAGFIRTMADVPSWLIVSLMVIGLGLIVAWGIGQSATLALVITVVELAGLIVVFFAAADQLPTIGQRWRELNPGLAGHAWVGVFLGGYLAFYSFVGFEDMVNVAEEVKNPSRNLPIAILVSVGLTTLIYFAVTLAVVLAVDRRDLAASDSPLSLVFSNPRAARLITGVGMLSGLNGALVQIVMASRVAYGMAQRGLAPAVFARVSRTTQTPQVATAAATLIVLVLALGFPIVTLANVTSTILLVIYALVNLSLIVIRQRAPYHPTVGPRYPIIVPILGAASCAAFIVFRAVAQFL